MDRWKDGETKQTKTMSKVESSWWIWMLTVHKVPFTFLSA